jgi:fucose permease
MYFPALLPQFKAAWNFDNAQAGWINGIFFRGYALTAPFLVSLTDKVHPGKAISAGYALGIFAGPWLQYLGWISLFINTLAGLTAFGLLWADLVFLAGALVFKDQL